jgi:hypothetical protein
LYYPPLVGLGPPTRHPTPSHRLELKRLGHIPILRRDLLPSEPDSVVLVQPRERTLLPGNQPTLDRAVQVAVKPRHRPLPLQPGVGCPGLEWRQIGQSKEQPD